MKKIFLMIILLLISSITLIAEKTISDIDSFEFEAREIIVINGKNRVKDYKIKAILPDLIKKEILSPKQNKGEIYIYNKTQKMFYLPIFDQSYVEDLNDEENYIIKVIKDIKEKERKDPRFKRDFYSGKIKEISYENGIKIVFENIQQVDGYYFPVKIKIYDKDIKVSEVVLKGVIINPQFKDGEFKL